jgi:hypothetical protein
MGPRKKENTGAAFEDRISSLFWPSDEIKEEEERRKKREEQQEEEDD